MLLHQTVKIVPGAVRFLGPAKNLRIAGPSGKAYLFHRDEMTVVQHGDWEWFESISDNQMRFELVSPPKTPKLIEISLETVAAMQDANGKPRDLPEVPSESAVVIKRHNKPRDLPAEDQN